MTEAEWLTVDPKSLVAFLRGKASNRKALLFCLAAARANVPDAAESTIEIWQAVECFVENRVNITELRDRLGSGLFSLVEDPWEWIDTILGDGDGWSIPPSSEVMVQLLRDIFPFHPITLDSAWLTSTVVSLAQQMYDSRDFSAMPILADALMDTGCSNETILQHCRGPGPHCRGCFVVDLLLGKE